MVRKNGNNYFFGMSHTSFSSNSLFLFWFCIHQVSNTTSSPFSNWLRKPENNTLNKRFTPNDDDRRIVCPSRECSMSVRVDNALQHFRILHNATICTVAPESNQITWDSIPNDNSYHKNEFFSICQVPRWGYFLLYGRREPFRWYSMVTINGTEMRHTMLGSIKYLGTNEEARKFQYDLTTFSDKIHFYYYGKVPDGLIESRDQSQEKLDNFAFAFYFNRGYLARVMIRKIDFSKYCQAAAN